MDTRLIAIFFSLLLLAACGGNKDTQEAPATPDRATLLQIKPHKEYTEVTVLDPWKPGQVLDNYILVPKDAELPSPMPKGTVVRVPLQRSIVYSGVHGNAIDRLGNVKAIAGVAEPQYFTTPSIVGLIKQGEIRGIGSAMEPSVEIIASLNPDAILLSPYQNAGTGVVGELGIPVIQMADYMEKTPLGRAEWIKFLGLLYGREDAANRLYDASVARYNALKALASKAKTHPAVLTEQVTDGVWYVPGGKSYQARLLTDAGAGYPWSDDSSTGSLQLDFAAVFDRAHDADIWLLKSQQSMSLSSLSSSYALNRELKAFKNQGVWCCNTLQTTMFDDFPFRPDTLLRDYIIIFHPELKLGETTYFKHVD